MMVINPTFNIYKIKIVSISDYSEKGYVVRSLDRGYVVRSLDRGCLLILGHYRTQDRLAHVIGDPRVV